MNDTVMQHYAEYLQETGDKAAAASLTLAAVMTEQGRGAPSPVEQPMTVSEVARLLRVKPQTVLTWIHSGDMTAANVAPRSGGPPRYRVTPTDLAAFNRDRAATTPSAAPRRAIRRGRPFAEPRHPTT
jgi:excisionase family DNA binding protein